MCCDIYVESRVWLAASATTPQGGREGRVGLCVRTFGSYAGLQFAPTTGRPAVEPSVQRAILVQIICTI